MLNRLREELKEATAQLARRDQLDVMLNELKVQLQELERQERTLYAKQEKESADVDAMERTTVTSIFYSLIGRKEEKLEKEQREAKAARLSYQAVVRELADCRSRMDALIQEREDLALYSDRCDALREQIRAELRSDPATAEQLCALEQKLGENQAQLREINEAISVGEEAMAQIEGIESRLSSAENWGTFDLFAGGGLISAMAKHSALDEAQAVAEGLQVLLGRFRTELADVHLDSQMGQLNIDGFARFADWFFDGLIVDWAVLSRIHNSQASVHRVKEQVKGVMDHLAALRSLREERQCELEDALERAVVG